MTGWGFLPLRLVSVVASLVVLAALAALVTQATGRRVAGVAAAGVYAVTYVPSGLAADVGRVDSLVLLPLTLLGVVAVARARTPAAGLVAAMVLVGRDRDQTDRRGRRRRGALLARRASPPGRVRRSRLVCRPARPRTPRRPGVDRRLVRRLRRPPPARARAGARYVCSPTGSSTSGCSSGPRCWPSGGAAATAGRVRMGPPHPWLGPRGSAGEPALLRRRVACSSRAGLAGSRGRRRQHPHARVCRSRPPRRVDRGTARLGPARYYPRSGVGAPDPRLRPGPGPSSADRGRPPGRRSGGRRIVHPARPGGPPRPPALPHDGRQAGRCAPRRRQRPSARAPTAGPVAPPTRARHLGPGHRRRRRPRPRPWTPSSSGRSPDRDFVRLLTAGTATAGVFDPPGGISGRPSVVYLRRGLPVPADLTPVLEPR